MQGPVKNSSGLLGRLEAQRQQVVDEMGKVDRQLVEAKQQLARLEGRWIELTNATRQAA